MITRTYQKGDADSVARYSPCETYRYELTRVWDTAAPKLGFIMLNPSKATERQNDPTIERCERRARALGFGGFRAVNIFALRETDPKKLRLHDAPDGPENDRALADACQWADMILAAWGTHGAFRDRGAAVRAVLCATGRPIHTLGLTKHGHPRHPLYVAYTTRPALWDIARETTR